MPTTSVFFKLGFRAKMAPTKRTAEPTTMKIIAPASRDTASMTREKDKMMMPNPTSANTGNSSGCNMRPRSEALYALSLDAPSLHDWMSHSVPAANSAMSPRKKTMGCVMRPATTPTKPTVAMSGHMLEVSCSAPAGAAVSPTATSPSRLKSDSPAISPDAVAMDNKATAPPVALSTNAI